MRTATAAVLTSALLVVGCSGRAEDNAVSLPPTPSVSVAPTTTGSATSKPEPTRRSTAPPKTRTPSPKPTPSRVAAVFHVNVAPITAQTRSRMRYSWRSGCPVALADLRLVTLDHWGYDDRVHRGELVVHRDAAAAVIGAMRRLFTARFPIQRMRLVDEYGGSDDRSMAANNTSAFNCRPVEGRPGVWSQHAYGRAIDVNPLVNPYVDDGRADPPAGQRYVDRSLRAPGLITAGGAAVRAFAAVGWGWGGNWRSVKDYQHFSSNGR
jgi:hypothetical protein